MKRLGDTSFKQLGKEFREQLTNDNVFNGAAALAYYWTLAIFPALIFLLSLIPYLPIDDLDSAIMDLLHQALPGEAAGALTENVQRLANERQGGLLSLGLLGTLWAASSGMYAIMQQLNITYGVKEGRSFIKARGVALLLTLLFGVLILGAFTLVVLGGVIQNWLASTLGQSEALLFAFSAARWVIIVMALLLGFALMYYLGPNTKQQFKWITPGSVVGVLMLTLASLVFRFYVANFGQYDATYGSLGAMIILMLWLYIAGLVLLAGSEVNVVYEQHLPEGKVRGEKHPGERRADTGLPSSTDQPALSGR